MPFFFPPDWERRTGRSPFIFCPAVPPQTDAPDFNPLPRRCRVPPAAPARSHRARRRGAVAAAAVPSRAPAAPRAELLAGRCGRAVPAPGGDSYRDGAPRSAPQPLAKFVRPRAGCGRTRPPSRALAMITLRLVAGLAWRPRAAASRPRGGPRRSGGAGGRGEERKGQGSAVWALPRWKTPPRCSVRTERCFTSLT